MNSFRQRSRFYTILSPFFVSDILQLATDCVIGEKDELKATPIPTHILTILSYDPFCRRRAREPL